jgi:restriction system protein
MAIPDFQSLMLPLLEALGDGIERSNAEIAKGLAQRFQLTDSDLREMLPSGQATFTNRVVWAKGSLRRAALLAAPTVTSYRITDQGKSVLAQHPPKIDIEFLKKLPSMDWYKKKKYTGGGAGFSGGPSCRTKW